MTSITSDRTAHPTAIPSMTQHHHGRQVGPSGEPLQSFDARPSEPIHHQDTPDQPPDSDCRPIRPYIRRATLQILIHTTLVLVK